MLAPTENAEWGGCPPEVEIRLDACQSGTQDAWYYSDQGPKDRTLQHSWPYKSGDRAQRAMDSDQKPCQTVDRYFGYTDCRTTYGGVFCAACETRDAGLDWLRADIRNLLLNEIDYWDRTVVQTAWSIRKIENGGAVLPEYNAGTVFREWVTQLKNARERVRATEKLLAYSTRQMEDLGSMIDQLHSEICAAEKIGQ